MTIWKLLTFVIVCQLLSLLLPRMMYFSMEGFTENPRLATLLTLKKTEEDEESLPNLELRKKTKITKVGQGTGKSSSHQRIETLKA